MTVLPYWVACPLEHYVLKTLTKVFPSPLIFLTPQSVETFASLQNAVTLTVRLLDSPLVSTYLVVRLMADRYEHTLASANLLTLVLLRCLHSRARPFSCVAVRLRTRRYAVS